MKQGPLKGFDLIPMGLNQTHWMDSHRNLQIQHLLLGRTKTLEVPEPSLPSRSPGFMIHKLLGLVGPNSSHGLLVEMK